MSQFPLFCAKGYKFCAWLQKAVEWKDNLTIFALINSSFLHVYSLVYWIPPNISPIHVFIFFTYCFYDPATDIHRLFHLDENRIFTAFNLQLNIWESPGSPNSSEKENSEKVEISWKILRYSKSGGKVKKICKTNIKIVNYGEKKVYKLWKRL